MLANFFKTLSHLSYGTIYTDISKFVKGCCVTLKQNCFKGINVRYQTGMENIQLAETQNKWDHVSKTQHSI